MGAKPQKTHDTNQTITWTPTLILVADYTDYRQNPPYDSTVNVASVFLSISVLKSAPIINHYEVHEYTFDNWSVIDSGTTNSGYISAPSDGWSSDSTVEDAEDSHTLYRLIVRDATTGNITTNSTFEVTNKRPTSCIEMDGSFAGTFTEHIRVKLDATCSSDMENDELSYQWSIDGIPITEENSLEVSFQKGIHTVELVATDFLGLSSTEQMTVNVSEFPFDDYASSTLLTLQPNASTTIHVENILYENTSVAPQWLNFGVIGTEIGVGLNIESKVVQIVEWELRVVHREGVTSFSKHAVQSTSETSLKINLALFILEISSGNETIYDLPMPMKEPVYDGQPSFPIGLFDRVYYWADLAVVDTSNPSSEIGSTSLVEIEISALDLLSYITTASTLIPGSQLPLLVLGVAVDYNLFLDLELQFDLSNSGDISMILMKSGDNEAVEVTNSSAPQVNNSTLDCFSYSIIDSSILVYGGIGMTLRIAQPAWLTAGLGFLYEDPMFLEGVWEYTIIESDEPLAISTGRNAQLSNTTVSSFLPIFIEDRNNTNPELGNDSERAGNDSSNDDQGNDSINSEPDQEVVVTAGENSLSIQPMLLLALTVLVVFSLIAVRILGRNRT